MIRNRNIAPDANIDLAKIAGGGGAASPLGKTFWVDSNTGDDKSGNGTKDYPYATLKAALGRCRNDKMDFILLAPTHSETITGAGGINVNKRTVTIVGLGTGAKRPTFLMDGGTTVTCTMTAADACIRNVIFKAGHSKVAACIVITADGCVVEHCRFIDRTTNENFLIAVKVGATDNDADGTIVRFNEVYSADTDGTNGVLINKNQHMVLIEGNWIHMDQPVAGVNCAIAAGAAEIQTALRVLDNVIDNNAADTALCINFQAANTGIIARNVSGDGDADGTPVVGAGMSCIENYHTGADAASGFLYPPVPTE